MISVRSRRAAAVVAAILALAILGSIGTVVVLYVRKRERVAACAGNLRELWKAQMTLLSLRGNRGPMPDHPLGKDYWAMLNRPPRVMDPGAFLCPVRKDFLKGEVQYWGPSDRLTRVQANGPVGCDAPDNHRRGGGNVLLKTGDVVESDGELWERCMKGACRP